MISGESQLLALSQAGKEVALATDWTQTIVILISLFGCGLWLHIDLINCRSELRQLRKEMRRDLQKFRIDMRRDMQKFRNDMRRGMQ